MTYKIEVLLKGHQHPTGESATHEDRVPADWTDEDVRTVLTSALSAVERCLKPDAGEPVVALRGLSWIVTPYESGVAIAIEIPSGAVVAGPFDIPERQLTDMIGRVLQSAAAESEPVH